MTEEDEYTSRVINKDVLDEGEAGLRARDRWINKLLEKGIDFRISFEGGVYVKKEDYETAHNTIFYPEKEKK